MKKHLLLISALFAIATVNAQPTWDAATYATANSIVADASIFTAKASITVGDIKFTADGGTNWLYKSTTGETTYNNVTYGKSYAQGQSNGKAGYLVTDAGSESSAAIFKPTKSGTLDLAFKFGYNKAFYIADFTDAILDTINLSNSASVGACTYNNSQYWGGYWSSQDGTYYTSSTTPTTDPAVTYYTGCTLNVVASHSYYVWASGSKLMLCGFTFTASSGSNVSSLTASDATVVSTEYYNILGARISEPTKGINIIRNIMSDGTIKTQKVIIRE